MSSEDVYAIAQRYLHHVKKTGGENIMAACPFHRKPDGTEERNPSFTMSLTKGLFFCFSCHEKGSLRTFLERMGLDDGTLNDVYNPLFDELEKNRTPSFDPLKPKLSDEPVPETLLGVFDYCPISLLDEGFTQETLQAFDVGFDQWHYRVTYPLRDFFGNLVGISGRAVGNIQPRYKVYDDEYLTWKLPYRKTNKRTILWNAHKVYPSVHLQNNAWVTLVEGFKACMWVHQAGFTQVEALLGSYMSDEQHWMLERQGAGVYVWMDNDDPGRHARKFIAKQLAKSLPVRVVEYPLSYKQPSDVPPQRVQEFLENSTDYYVWAMSEGN